MKSNYKINKAQPILRLFRGAADPTFTANRGFGLLEVVIASAVLIMVIASSVGLSRMAIRNSVVGLERVQAYNLAQEGIEQIRKIRDTSWIDGNQDVSWENLFIDTFQKEITLDNKVFNRTIRIENVPSEANTFLFENGVNNNANDLMKKVTVKVSWQEYGLDWSIDVITYLSNWKPAY